jgi:hypothetical protein
VNNLIEYHGRLGTDNKPSSGEPGSQIVFISTARSCRSLIRYASGITENYIQSYALRKPIRRLSSGAGFNRPEAWHIPHESE